VRADAMRDEPIPVMLANQPGPHRLPKCKTVGVVIRSPDKADLLSDAESGQCMLVELDPNSIESSHNLLSVALKGWHGG
jgi:hypothetical protein